MTSNKKIYLYLATNLAFIVPVPGRFAYGIIMLFLFNIQMLAITSLFHAVHNLELANMRNSILALAIISLSIFYKQLLTLLCPIAALTLGYCIFLPTLASVIIEFFFLDYEHGLKNHVKLNMRHSALMSVFVIVFFFIRDVFGYGTLTFPGNKSLIVLHLPYSSNFAGALSFLASIPGSLALVAILLAFYIFVEKKFIAIMKTPYFSKEQD